MKKPIIFVLFVLSILLYGQTVHAAQIYNTSPRNNATEVSTTNRPIVIHFDMMIQEGSDFQQIVLKDSSGAVIDTTKIVSGGNTLSIKPNINLLNNTKYILTIPQNAVIDGVNNPMDAAYTLSFTTWAQSTSYLLNPGESISIADASPDGIEVSTGGSYDTAVYAGISGLSKPVGVEHSAQGGTIFLKNHHAVITNTGNISYQVTGPTNSFHPISSSEPALRLVNLPPSKTIFVNKVAFDSFVYVGSRMVSIPVLSKNDLYLTNNEAADLTIYGPYLGFSFTEVPTAPRVYSKFPEETGGTLTDASITIGFTCTVKAGSDINNITLVDSLGNLILTDNSINDSLLTIKPRQILEGNSIYTVTIPAASVLDPYGNPMLKDYSYSFATVGMLPMIRNVDPVNNAVNVPVDKTITIRFSNEMQSGLHYNNIILEDNNGSTVPVKCSMSSNYGELTVDPDNNLESNTKYTLTVPSSAVVSSLYGYPLGKTYSFAFTTAGKALTVNSAKQTKVTNGLMQSDAIVVTFSSNIQAGNAYDGIKILDENDTVVEITKDINGNTLTIQPNDDLLNSTQYTLIIPAAGVADAFSNAMAEDYSFGFTPLAEPPAIKSAMTNGSGNAVIIAFSKEMALPQGTLEGFSVTVNNMDNKITNVSSGSNEFEYILTLEKPISYNQAVTMSYKGETVEAQDGGSLEPFSDYKVVNKTQISKKPVVIRITPSSGSTAGGTKVTIIGTGFTRVTGVKFGSKSVKFKVNSSTSITVVSPPGTGIADITVTTLSGTSVLSKTGKFRYVLPRIRP